MALTDDTEALMLAYVYGELTASAARAFEERMAKDPELRAEVEGLMATHKLLGDDAEWGLRSGTDAPPPHLVDAILKAEALARPPEIRQAGIARAEVKPTFTARLSRWLIGGGVLVGATAAVLVVVTTAQPEMASVTVAAPVVSEPSAAAPSAAPAPESVPDLAPEDNAFEEGLAKPAELELADERRGARDAQRVFDALDGEPASRRPSLADTDGRFSEATASHGGWQGATGAAPAGPVRLDPKPAKDVPRDTTDDTVDGDAKVAQVVANKQESAEGKALKPKEPAREPAPVVMAPPPAESVGSIDLPPRAKADSAPRTQSAPSPPPASGSGAYRDDSFGFDTAAPSKKKLAAKEERADKLSDRAGEKLSVEERSNRRRVLLDEKSKSAAKAPAAPRAERKMPQADLAMETALMELSRGNALVALDEFQNAERLDTRRLLGSDPVFGQIRSLVLLKRPQDALKLADQLLKRDLKEPGVADALAYAADVAEKNNERDRARRYWSALLNAPVSSYAQKARKNVDRLGTPKAVRAAPADASAEADAEAAAPAASESAKH